MSQSKILINLAFLLSQPTGITNYALNLLPYLQKLQPTLLIGKAKPGYDCQLIPDNLTPEQGKIGHLKRLLWTESSLPSIYDLKQASLLFSPIPEAPIFSNCNYIVMVHDLIPLRFQRLTSPLTPYFRYYVPQVVNKAKHIICNSVATARDLTEFFGVPTKKITPIYLAYDSNHFQPRETNQKVDIPYFLYLGRHDPHKNLSRILQAFAMIAPKCEEQLWLAGPEDRRYTPKLAQLGVSLGIKNRLKFLNYVSYQDLPQLLTQATALVYPSLWEGFGLPILEAMACSTPVITSNLASLPEVAGDAAWLVNPYKVESIAEAMENVATHPQVRSRLSQLGLIQANRFSWQKTGEETKTILSQYS